MIKVELDTDEWYPIHTLSTDLYEGAFIVEVEEGLLRRYQEALREFDQVQKLLRDLYQGNTL